MSSYENWPTIELSTNNTLLRPEAMPELVHMEDPAINVMVDFKLAKAFTIHLHEAIDHALNEMKINGVHMLLVIDGEKLVGLVSTEDILGEKPIMMTHERRIPRERICVETVMTPVTDIIVFDIESLKHAKIGNIIQTLKSKNQHYALVVRNINHDEQWIRGLFSSSLINKKLHRNIS